MCIFDILKQPWNFTCIMPFFFFWPWITSSHLICENVFMNKTSALAFYSKHRIGCANFTTECKNRALFVHMRKQAIQCMFFKPACTLAQHFSFCPEILMQWSCGLAVYIAPPEQTWINGLHNKDRHIGEDVIRYSRKENRKWALPLFFYLYLTFPVSIGCWLPW